MKSDLDALMQARSLDAILITGPAQHNPAMYYMTGGVHLTGGDLIKKRGAEPVLFCNLMEREEAARTGFPTRSLADYRLNDLLKEYDYDMARAMAERYRRMFADLGITAGRVGVYGRMDAGAAFSIFNALSQAQPGLSLTGEADDSMLQLAMATKDGGEIERMRRMGQVTTQVVGMVADYLTSQRTREGVLVDSDGRPVTVGDVKQRINLWLAERGADNPEGTIFAIGRDAGVPHSSGSSADLLRLGETIVFDIFPCEAGGGYFYDFTRTWCLGFAPDPVLALYEDVFTVFQTVMSELHVGVRCADLQKRTCELFEAQGHPTINTNPQTTDGYVHSLGHGVGLNIHERPVFRQMASNTDTLQPNHVTTIEPGLYYPERGMGVRLEDTVWVRPDGGMEVLAPYPLDLVLPVKMG